MSSKSARRRERRKAEQQVKTRKANPAIVFILVIGGVVLALVVAGLVFGIPGGPGDPPWPGAVWDAGHGHWH